MKQTLSSETPARVRRGQLRAVVLGLGVSAMALACSFGEIDNTDTEIQPPDQNIPNAGNEDTGGSDPVEASGPARSNNSGPSTPAPGTAKPAAGDDYFANSELGK